MRKNDAKLDPQVDYDTLSVSILTYSLFRSVYDSSRIYGELRVPTVVLFTNITRSSRHYNQSVNDLRVVQVSPSHRTRRN